MIDIIWLVAIKSPYGLNATAHRTESEALEYVRKHLGAPAHLDGRDILAWVGANTDDEVLVDYDEI